MNGNGSGIVPTVDLATNNNNGYGFGYPVMPVMGGYGYGNNGGFFGGEGIWAIVLLALIFGNNGFGGFGGNGWNNVATTDFVSSEFTQRDVTNGTQSILTALSNGFSDNATNVCNLRSDVLTGNMGLQNNILSSANATQRDILQQTNELNTNLLTTQLNAQAQLDNCCCQIREEGLANTQRILDAIQNNTIQDLRDRLNTANDIISDQRIESNIINSVRPYPVPAYLTGSPYVGYGYGFNNGFWGNNGFYGNGFFGNTIV